MKKNFILIINTLIISIFFSSCKKEEFEPYNHPFIHINYEDKDAITIKSNVRDIFNYKVYLSAALQFEPIDVTYEIVPGDGLQEGVDYKVITEGNTLHFVQGIFEKPVTIEWLDHQVDPGKDNSLTIRLLNNSKGYTLGLPGPSGHQKQLVITKIN